VTGAQQRPWTGKDFSCQAGRHGRSFLSLKKEKINLKLHKA